MKKLSIGMVLVLVLAFVAYQVHAVRKQKWQAYVFTSQYDVENNFKLLGEYDDENGCKSSVQSMLSRGIEINFSNFHSTSPIVADSWLCGKSCLFPDGPGDVSISEIKCSRETRGKLLKTIKVDLTD